MQLSSHQARVPLKSCTPQAQMGIPPFYSQSRLGGTFKVPLLVSEVGRSSRCLYPLGSQVWAEQVPAVCSVEVLGDSCERKKSRSQRGRQADKNHQLGETGRGLCSASGSCQAVGPPAVA